MRLYFQYLLLLFKSQMQYRTSFWLLSLGQFLVPFSAFAGLYFLFERFGQIKGWDFYEVALCFAIIHMAFALSEYFARGFDNFSFVQVLGSKFEFTRVGRLLQSVIVLGWAVSNLAIDWSFLKILTLLLMIISGVFIFTGIFILAATLSFWTIQGLEIANIFTDGGREMAQYPLNIYQKWVTRFFTFVIPFGSVNYLPLLYLLGKGGKEEWLYMLTPLAGIIFILPCIFVWIVGVRHYRSTGS